MSSPTPININAGQFITAARALAIFAKYEHDGAIDLVAALADPQDPLRDLLGAVMPDWQQLSIDDLVAKVPEATERVAAITNLLEQLKGQAADFGKAARDAVASEA